MINPNYNYTNPISAINTVNIAKGVPYPTEDRRPVREIEDNYNKNRFNQEQRFYNTSMINITASAQKNRVNLIL